MKKQNRIVAWLLIGMLLVTMLLPAKGNAATKVAKPKLQSSEMQANGNVIVKFIPKSGVTIYYTTNGKKPVPEKSGTKKYSKKGIRLTATKTIKAVAKKGSQVSAVYSKKFKTEKPLDPPKYLGAKIDGDGFGIIKFELRPGIEIYYTTNGENPVRGSDYTSLYEDKVGIVVYEEINIIKAVAVKGNICSKVVTKEIDIGEDNAYSAKRYMQARKKAKGVVENLIKPNMDEYSKIQVLHDYIVNNVAYDLGNPNTIESDDRGTAAGALLDGKANCTGYSTAFEWLCEYAGIETKGLNSPEMNHGWSLVKYNDYWYHVDPTWDDDGDGSNEERKYRYFLLTDQEMAKDHTWVQSKYPACNGPYVPKPYEK